MRRIVGLRVDVDTHVGMRDGLPKLLEIFARTGTRSTVYLSMGPDRSGMAVLNVFKPGFLAKMRRTSAVASYGLRTVLSGTLLPSRPIATAYPDIAREARSHGQETGVHAWNHRKWQDRLLKLPEAEIEAELRRGLEAYVAIFGDEPETYAAPAWLSCERAQRLQESLGLRFGSDCRGTEPFLPVFGDRTLATPQVPTTLPTLDELLGLEFESGEAYFAAMGDALRRSRGSRWPVLTIHTEMEGAAYAGPFADFLCTMKADGFDFVGLGELLDDRVASGPLPRCAMVHGEVTGRHGVVSVQGQCR